MTTYSISTKGKKIVTSANKEVITKILKGIQKHYKPEEKIKFKLIVKGE